MLDIINIIINKLKKVYNIITSLKGENNEGKEDKKEKDKENNIKTIIINNENRTLAQLICFIIDNAKYIDYKYSPTEIINIAHKYREIGKIVKFLCE